MTLYSDPPPLLRFQEVKPTLLVCWWITIFCITIILFRVSGRYVRTERLFPEDKTVALAVIPLLLRMGCVHVVLIYGTNNADFSSVEISDEESAHKSIASGLVLASRVFYAAILWVLKSASLDFFKRLIGFMWTNSYARMLFLIRCLLVATFIAVIISDLAECRPFNHYWQVLPDPGGQCRQGYAQLLTTAACNIFTDLLLVFFPIPIILRSAMTTKRKLQLVALFSLSLAIVATTLYRVPHVIWAHGSQQLRSLLASVELLFATATGNALVIGSFVRDRGIKKRKFKHGGVADRTDLHGPKEIAGSKRRPTLLRHWGSDEDLVRDLGLGVEPALRNTPQSEDLNDEAMIDTRKFTPAPPVAPDMNNWRFPPHHHSAGSSSSGRKRATAADASDASLLSRDNVSPSPTAPKGDSTMSPRKGPFFDVGRLLDDTSNGGLWRENRNASADPLSLIDFPDGNEMAPTPALRARNSGFRRGSTALLQDLGGLVPRGHRPNHRTTRTNPSVATEPHSIPQGQSGGLPDLVDAGGLLNQPP